MKMIEKFILLFSRQKALALGRFLGILSYYIFQKRRKLALHNLELALGNQYDAPQRKKIVYQLFSHFGMNAIEFFRFSEITEHTLSDYVTLHGKEILDELYQQKKGILALSAHIGNWEFLTVSLSLAGYKGGVISKSARQNIVNNYLIAHRQNKNIIMLAGKRITKDILKILKSGGIVGVVLDQHGVTSESVPTPFFGRTAQTLKSLAVLALRTGSPVVPMYTYRDKNQHHHVIIEQPIPLSAEDTVETCTLKYTQWIESAIRKHPEQWIWTHNRWKNTG